MSEAMPTWEQRLRAPQLKAWSLLGPAVSWARDRERGVLLSNASGRFEVVAFDASSRPAALRHVTDRPQGTIGAAIAPDGEHVWWFDDVDGDEAGGWQRQPFAGGDDAVMLGTLPPAYGAGIVTRRGGAAAIGRLTADGFELALAEADGGGRVVYRSSEHANLVDADDRLALISHPPDNDFLHPATRVIDVNGSVLAELAEPGYAVRPIAISPRGDGRVLVAHTRRDRNGLLLWDPESGQTEEVDTGLEGDIDGRWLPDGDGLLLIASLGGRDALYRLDFGSGAVELLRSRQGVVDEVSARADGTVQALVESAEQPPHLIEVGDGIDEGGAPIVVLEGEPPAASVVAEDVEVDGPGGRVHAFLHRPIGAAAPFPTVFMPHGGPTAQDVDAFRPLVAALVDAGYAVVRVNYRGSTGYGQAWRDALRTRLGEIEMEDLGAVRRQLEADGVIDPARVAIAGGSWGGYLTLYALGVEPTRWAAGVAIVPLADFAMSMEDQPPFMTAYDRVLFGGTLEEMPEEYRRASPLTYVDAVRSPVLITAGTNDPRCPPRPTDEYVARLRSRGADVEYLRKETGHGSYDNEQLVEEIQLVLGFLSSRMPAKR